MTKLKKSNYKLRIGIVGLGRISRNHVEAIFNLRSDLSLVAVCDVNDEIVREFTTTHGVQGFSALPEMVERVEMDLVVLCTPSGLHASQTVIAAKKGISVLTEKPMATNISDAREMIAACDAANVKLYVMKQNRLNETVQHLKSAFKKNRFGAIHLIQANIFWTRPQQYYDHGSGWRGTWEFDGGAFMNQASHYFDLLTWLMGPAESINATLSTTRNIEAEDSGVANIKWKNGALGSISVTMLTYPKNYEGSITVLGERGTVRLSGIALNKAETWEFEEKSPEDYQIQKSNYETKSVYGFGHQKYYEELVKEVQYGIGNVSDGRSGIQSLEMIVGAYRSFNQMCTIRFPLDRY